VVDQAYQAKVIQADHKVVDQVAVVAVVMEEQAVTVVVDKVVQVAHLVCQERQQHTQVAAQELIMVPAQVVLRAVVVLQLAQVVQLIMLRTMAVVAELVGIMEIQVDQVLDIKV
jgi:hypothetical protein